MGYEFGMTWSWVSLISKRRSQKIDDCLHRPDWLAILKNNAPRDDQVVVIKVAINDWWAAVVRYPNWSLWPRLSPSDEPLGVSCRATPPYGSFQRVSRTFPSHRYRPFCWIGATHILTKYLLKFTSFTPFPHGGWKKITVSLESFQAKISVPCSIEHNSRDIERWSPSLLN